MAALKRAAVVSIEAYLDGCRRLWRRYVTLGMCLLVTYGVTALVYTIAHTIIYFALRTWDFGIIANELVTRLTIIIATRDWL